MRLAHPAAVERVRDPLRDFLPGDDEEAVPGAEQGVERRDVGEVFVLGDEREVVAVGAEPAHDIVHGHVTVRVERVGVGVAFEPTALCMGVRRDRH